MHPDLKKLWIESRDTWAPTLTSLAGSYPLIGAACFDGKPISKSNSHVSNKFTGRKVLPTKYRDYEYGMAMQARAAFGIKNLTQGWVVFFNFFQNKKHIDINNVTKSGMDFLQAAQVLKHDKYIGVVSMPAVYGAEGLGMMIWGTP